MRGPGGEGGAEQAEVERGGRRPGGVAPRGGALGGGADGGGAHDGGADGGRAHDGGADGGGAHGGPTIAALTVPVVLALVAGFVDSVAFLHLFGVFPANQSGNVVLFGIGLGGDSPSPVWATAGAIIGFMAGTAGGRWLSGRLPASWRGQALLAIELGLLVAVTATVAVLDPGGSGLLADGWRLALLLVAAVAMGVQTEVVRRSAGVAVATTYQTGAIARIGEAIGTLPGTAERAGARRLVLVLGAVLAGYVGGAALGATILGHGRYGLVPACLVVAAVLAVTTARPTLLGTGDVS